MKSPFRSIRQTLFNEGKLLRYLGYAIGEILLIIVGIFFALQLNNLNEDRKAQAEFELYIVQLREDVREAIEQNKGVFENNEVNGKRGVSIIAFLEQPDYTDEEFEVFKLNLLFLGRYRPGLYNIGLLGELLEGNMDTLGRDPDLLKETRRLTSFLKLEQDRASKIHGALSNDQQRLVQFRGPAPRRNSELQIRFDLDQLRTSKEFIYITQSIVTRTSILNRDLREVIVRFESFLTVLEEYE